MKRKRDLKSFHKLRNEIFSQADQYRAQTGRHSLKHSVKATKDLDIAFNFIKRNTVGVVTKHQNKQPESIKTIHTSKNWQEISNTKSTVASRRDTVNVIIEED